MRDKIFIIVNPTAGDGLAEKRWENFETDLNNNNIAYEAVFTEYKNHATKIIANAIELGFRRVGIFSGDGTLNEVLQGLFYKDVIVADDLKLIFFPAGSSCDFEKKFGHCRNWLQRIVAKDSISIDVFKVECYSFSSEPIVRYIINNSSIGIISMANEKFNSVSGMTKWIKQKNVDLGAIICGLQAIIQFQSYNAEIVLDGNKIPLKNFSNVTTFKTAYFGGDMNYGVETVQDDGKLSIVCIEGTSKFGLASLMPSLFTGAILKKKQAHYMLGQQFELYTNDKVIVETDGENIGIPPVKYTILPKAIQIIV